MAVIRIKLTLAYDGTRYAGWQVQNKPLAQGLPTVQNELEILFQRIIGTYTVVHCAGRTDAGVHAEAQVCHVDIPQSHAHVPWLHSLNRLLPPDIRILEARPVPHSFHARRDALHKTYAYTLWCDKQKALPRLAPYCWSVPPLDQERMLEAAQYLIGTHDFSSLRNKGSAVRTSTRTLFFIEPHHHTLAGMHCPSHWPVVSWHVNGDGFLKQMVRNILGLLVWVGQHKIAPHAVPELLLAKNRKALPSPSAPAQGLTLLNISYPS